MNVKQYLPSAPQVSKETIAVLIATVAAAWIISRFPSVREFVNSNSVVIRDANGDTIKL